MLHAARAALRTDPARALVLTEEHRRRFPRGLLAEERDAIRISALAALGRTEEARREAESFSKDHPDSVHRDRIEGVTREAP